MRTPVIVLAAVLSLSSAGSSLAQTTPSRPPSANDRAMAAGYKALTLCSAVFNAREAGTERTVQSVEANELVGVYPEMDPLIPTLKAEFGASSVSVAWDDAMPARVARHATGRGCTIQPVGWTGATDTPITAAAVSTVPPLATGTAAGDATALGSAVQQAFAGEFGAGANTTAVVVVQNGRVVAERYAPGFGPRTPQRTWSVAKSLAGALVGAAVLRGEADVEAPATIANWRTPGDPRGAITLGQLLHMASGLTSDTAGNRTDALYFGGVSVDEQTPGWPLIATPGSRFRYANNDILLATLSLEPTFAQHSPNALFRRIGMTDTTAETDWRGHYILSSQVWTTARDLARFGMLYLNDGVLDGERVLPVGWRDYVSTASGPQPTGEFGYGATFWLMNHSPGVPPETFAAFGNRGQYVVIVPSRDIVIVRRGEDATGKRFDIAAFTRDVLASLE